MKTAAFHEKRCGFHEKWQFSLKSGSFHENRNAFHCEVLGGSPSIGLSYKTKDQLMEQIVGLLIDKGK